MGILTNWRINTLEERITHLKASIAGSPANAETKRMWRAEVIQLQAELKKLKKKK